MTAAFSEQAEVYRLYRWIAAGILLPEFISAWAVWKATKSIFNGLLILIAVVFVSILASLILIDSGIYGSDSLYLRLFGHLFKRVLAFLILYWAWIRLPEQMKVYGW